MGKNRIIKIDDLPINITTIGKEDYVNLTDMVRSQKEGTKLIEKWLSSKNTIEFLGIWEQMNSDDFNSPEFGGIMQEAGTNRFYMSVKQWVTRTGAIGIKAKAGKYGGTYAHKDIAFHFGLYISPMFNLLLIKEFQRLKEIESNEYNLEWNVKRILSKVNYRVQTDAVKEFIIPTSTVSKDKEWVEYAKEADLLNVALIGCTSKEWKEANPKLALSNGNPRDCMSINELAVLANMESLNAVMIEEGASKELRFKKLKHYAAKQLAALNDENFLKSIRKESETTYLDVADADPIIPPMDKVISPPTNLKEGLETALNPPKEYLDKFSKK